MGKQGVINHAPTPPDAVTGITFFNMIIGLYGLIMYFAYVDVMDHVYLFIPFIIALSIAHVLH